MQTRMLQAHVLFKRIPFSSIVKNPTEFQWDFWNYRTCFTQHLISAKSEIDRASPRIEGFISAISKACSVWFSLLQIYQNDLLNIPQCLTTMDK